ncbi:hypothetical protein [Achromobacter insolitus]|uniref:hypothetical protein n=1 Tax=Achromobacter insolitus TaxID=217204 RepID=UPI0028AC7DE1|nr:hypothetical protein [Achromobacter insolitus]
MNLAAQKLMPWLLVLLLAVITWMQRQALDGYQEALPAIKQTAEANAKAARDLQDAADLLASRTRAVQTEQEAIRASLSAREIDVKRLQNEVTEIRSWADSLLPAGITGLRQRPAIVGGADYDKYLSSRDAVQPASGSAPDKW